MKVETRTDLDFLTELMQSKQRVVKAERDVEGAKAELKEARNEMNGLLDKLEPHVQLRRDELMLPRFPTFGSDTKLDLNKESDDDAGDDEDDSA